MFKKFGAVLLVVMISVFVASCGSGGTSDSSNTGGSGDSGGGFPSKDKDVTLLVPFGAGGSTDSVARALSPYFEEELGQTVNVRNIAAASGAKAMNQLVNSEPDGYTVAMLVPGPGIVTPLSKEVGYTPDDYAPIGRISTADNMVVVPSDSPYNSVEDLFQAAKDNPGEISVATPGASALQSIVMRAMAENAGVEVEIVPFDSGAKSRSALLGGNVDASFNAESEVAPYIQSGDLKGIGITSSERQEDLPDVPTLKEQGFETPGAGFFGMTAPPDTPPEVVDKWESTLKGALNDSDTVDRLKKLELEPNFVPSGEFKQYINDIVTNFKPILQDNGG